MLPYFTKLNFAHFCVWPQQHPYCFVIPLLNFRRLKQFFGLCKLSSRIEVNYETSFLLRKLLPTRTLSPELSSVCRRDGSLKVSSLQTSKKKSSVCTRRILLVSLAIRSTDLNKNQKWISVFGTHVKFDLLVFWVCLLFQRGFCGENKFLSGTGMHNLTKMRDTL